MSGTAAARIVVGIVLTLLPLALSAAVYSDNDKSDNDKSDNDKSDNDKSDNNRLETDTGTGSNKLGSKVGSKVGKKVSTNSMAWLQALDQSPLTPPPYVFGVVWTTLYLLMGAALALFVDRAFRWTTTKVSKSASKSVSKSTNWVFFALGLVFFAAQLAANYAYLRVMFVDHDVRLGLHVLYALMALFACACLAFAPVSPLSAALLCPCAAYLVYAAVLHSYLDANNDFT